MRRKSVGCNFSGFVQILNRACNPCSERCESDYAQHSGGQRLWSTGPEYIRTAPELLGSFAVAKTYGTHGAGPRTLAVVQYLHLCALLARPFRWSSAAR